jgi:hypothetical protein
MELAGYAVAAKCRGRCSSQSPTSPEKGKRNEAAADSVLRLQARVDELADQLSRVTQERDAMKACLAEHFPHPSEVCLQAVPACWPSHQIEQGTPVDDP